MKRQLGVERIQSAAKSWKGIRLALVCALSLASGGASALEQGTESAEGLMRDAQGLYQSQHYFTAARYAFRAKELNPALTSEAYTWITLGLTRAKLYQSASYFFIRTLQTNDTAMIRRVLPATQEILMNVGADVLRKYLIRHTKYEDYDAINRSAYLYALGRSALLSGDAEKAAGYLNAIHSGSPLRPFALQLRGSAYAISGKNEQAIQDFRACVAAKGSEDLIARCIAGQARTLYQMEKFEEADQVYDQIAKASLVWPDILFEQAWNAFARREYNRTLGKLVSYKSPALSFVFNPEVDVLRAQTYLALCLYDDASAVIDDFNRHYGKIGDQIKQFVEGNSSNLGAFYDAGVRAIKSPLYTEDGVQWMLNRFVRGPYFKDLVTAQEAIAAEMAQIQMMDSTLPGVSHSPGQGFPGFLRQVLGWRSRSIRVLGGVFVKNSLLDHYSELISNFDKMSFIKLEMLKRAKDRLVYKNRQPNPEDRNRGNIAPTRRDYQYYWSFNGEFWNDELGDYVFGLESECKGAEGV